MDYKKKIIVCHKILQSQSLVPVGRTSVLRLKEPGRRLPAGEAARHRAQQRVLERLPEVPVEVSVDQRVQRRIEVAYPEQHAYQPVRRRAVVFAAQRRYHVPKINNDKFL